MVSIGQFFRHEIAGSKILCAFLRTLAYIANALPRQGEPVYSPPRGWSACPEEFGMEEKQRRALLCPVGGVKVGRPLVRSWKLRAGGDVRWVLQRHGSHSVC